MATKSQSAGIDGMIAKALTELITKCLICPKHLYYEVQHRKQIHQLGCPIVIRVNGVYMRSRPICRGRGYGFVRGVFADQVSTKDLSSIACTYSDA